MYHHLRSNSFQNISIVRGDLIQRFTRGSTHFAENRETNYFSADKNDLIFLGLKNTLSFLVFFQEKLTLKNDFFLVG